MNKFSLSLYKLVLWPSAIYRSWGIDSRQLALILRAKLTMDDRRPNTFQQTRSGQKKEGISNAMLGTMLIALLMGVANLIVFAFGKDDITHFTFFFLAFMFLLASILITDFTSVLIDVRDNMILLPRPINDRTILMARLLHIIVHLNRVILPMSIPVVIYLTIEKGWWAALSLFVLLAFACLFAIFLMNAVYLFVLKLMSPEKFKSFIAWFQIGFVIFLYGGYQIFLRLTDRRDFQEFSLANSIPVRYFPPYWFARAWETLNGAGGNMGWFWVLLSVGGSCASIWAVVRFLAPAFNRKLAMIHGSAAQENSQPSVNAVTPANKKQGIGEFLSRLLMREAAARAGFMFTWRWTNRNRGFRMRVYPTIGYLVVWVVLMLVNKQGDDSTGGSANVSLAPFSFILLIYLSSFIIISAIHQLSISDDYKAAWIFFSYPVKTPGVVIRGGFYSLLCKFYLPLAIILFITGITWKGFGILPNLLLGLSNQLAICSIILLMSTKAFPASRPIEMKDRSGNFLKSMLMLVITGLTGMVHLLVFKFTAVVLLLAVLSVVANWLLLKKIGEIGWLQIREFQ